MADGVDIAKGHVRDFSGHHCHRNIPDFMSGASIGGNAQLAQKFRDALGEEVVHNGIKVTAISEKQFRLPSRPSPRRPR